MFETVARERLVETQQGGKGLAGAVVIFELWR
jgi:molybdenum-dependent DNA-binding transcriptional regulator ModE